MSDIIWEQTLDDGKYTLRVTRIDGYTATLQVLDANEEQLHSQVVTLNYGAQFGPDMDDVAEWQEITISVVKNHEKGDT